MVQRRGPRSLGVVGSAAWNLAELVELRVSGGLDAVGARLAEPATGPVAGPAPERASEPGAVSGSGAGGRRIRMETGYERNPWADLKPAGEGAATPPGKLWHSSPGSPG